MMDKVHVESGSLAFARPETGPLSPVKQSHADESNGFQLFGRDGLTFFDFLDVINPLHHIPIVSKLYRSITGDSIDPGAKIAGGTLFGGPLGAALSGLDVAVKHSTGRDIADHTVAFFTGATNEQNTPAPAGTGVKTATLDPAQMGYRSDRDKALVSEPQPIEAGLLPLTVSPMQTPPPTAHVTKEKFRAAGMSAIPIPNRPSDVDSRGSAVIPSSLPDLGLLGDIAQPAAPNDPLETPVDITPRLLSPQVLSRHALNKEAAKARQDRLTATEPYHLTPKFSLADAPTAASGAIRSQPVSRTAPTTFLTPTRHTSEPIQAITQTMSDTKTSWIADAMRQGLNKYQSANSLTVAPSQLPAVSVRR